MQREMYDKLYRMFQSDGNFNSELVEELQDDLKVQAPRQRALASVLHVCPALRFYVSLTDSGIHAVHRFDQLWIDLAHI